jgi:hypothetical protein
MCVCVWMCVSRRVARGLGARARCASGEGNRAGARWQCARQGSVKRSLLSSAPQGGRGSESTIYFFVSIIIAAGRAVRAVRWCAGAVLHDHHRSSRESQALRTVHCAPMLMVYHVMLCLPCCAMPCHAALRTSTTASCGPAASRWLDEVSSSGSYVSRSSLRSSGRGVARGGSGACRVRGAGRPASRRNERLLSTGSPHSPTQHTHARTWHRGSHQERVSASLASRGRDRETLKHCIGTRRGGDPSGQPQGGLGGVPVLPHTHAHAEANVFAWRARLAWGTPVLLLGAALRQMCPGGCAALTHHLAIDGQNLVRGLGLSLQAIAVVAEAESTS